MKLLKKSIKGISLISFLIYLYLLFFIKFELGGGEGKFVLSKEIWYTFFYIPILGVIFVIAFCISLINPIKIIFKQLEGFNHDRLKLKQVIAMAMVLIYTIFVYFTIHKYDGFYNRSTPNTLIILPIILLILIVGLGLFDGIINPLTFELISGCMLLSLFCIFLIFHLYSFFDAFLFFGGYILIVGVNLFNGITTYIKNKYIKKAHLLIINLVVAALLLILDILIYKAYYEFSIIIASFSLLNNTVYLKRPNKHL